MCFCFFLYSSTVHCFLRWIGKWCPRTGSPQQNCEARETFFFRNTPPPFSACLFLSGPGVRPPIYWAPSVRHTSLRRMLYSVCFTPYNTCINPLNYSETRKLSLRECVTHLQQRNWSVSTDLPPLECSSSFYPNWAPPTAETLSSSCPGLVYIKLLRTGHHWS